MVCQGVAASVAAVSLIGEWNIVPPLNRHNSLTTGLSPEGIVRHLQLEGDFITRDKHVATRGCPVKRNNFDLCIYS
ncbi:hypothetical protein K8I28_11565, partial [bacterium]|nr:hypothetical protein [bacterium]